MWPFSKAATVDLSFAEEPAPAQCGASGAGACFWTHPGPGCNDADCCQLVCIVDPGCCSTTWDAVCVGHAGETCTFLPGPGLLINPVNGHRYRIDPPTTWNLWSTCVDGEGTNDYSVCPVTVGTPTQLP